MDLQKHGFFISYRRRYAFAAGRIFDFLAHKGMDPYMDVYSMSQDDYWNVIESQIMSCPYFLLVLSEGCFDDITDMDIFYKEIETAFTKKPKKSILIVKTDGYDVYKESVPEGLSAVLEHHIDTISHAHFSDDMNHVLKNIDHSLINQALDWYEYTSMNGKTVVGSRSTVESKYATLENRFGRELVEAVKNKKEFTGKQIIKQIHMSCYAASIILNPDRSMVDDQAFDHGMLFNIFGELLNDPEFSMEIVINAPDSRGAEESIRNEMLGNRALEEYPEAVFLGAYYGLNRLIKDDIRFKKAYEEKRFRFYLTDVVMTGAIFQIRYKDEWSYMDHIKYDIYTYNLTSNMDRRCMIVFKQDDNDNYEFFLETYHYLKKKRYTKQMIEEKSEVWLQNWLDLKEEM